MSVTRRIRRAKARKRFYGRVAHTKEQNFLVGNREPVMIQNDNTDTNDMLKAPPVSLITVSIPVQFQINDIMAWAYRTPTRRACCRIWPRAPSCITSRAWI